MSFQRLAVLRTFTIALAALISLASVHAEEMLVGKAIVDITPPIPYRMSGYFSERLSTGIKDRLYAKTLVFKQGSHKGALVFCDLIGISPSVAKKAKSNAEKLTGIPIENISIAATHSHTGPLYFGALRKHFHERKIAASGKDDFESVDYPANLISKIAASIQQADAKASPVKITADNAIEKRLSFNRRFHMKNGEVRFNPGQQNPNIVRVAGPIDPEVGIISFTAEGSEIPWGALVSFALHLDTVGGTEYSADYPKHMEDQLKKNLGSEFVSFFGAGTCGDINHIDVKIKGRRSSQEIGNLLANTIENKIRTMGKPQTPMLAFGTTSVDALLQTFSEQQIAEAEKNMQLVDVGKLSFLDRVHAYKVNAVRMRKSKSIPLQIHAIRLTKDCAIVTLPGEVFVELGLAIKTASPFDKTLVIELANDAPGYIPTRKAFAEGSYETVNSRIQPGFGEKMTTAAIRLLKELDRK